MLSFHFQFPTFPVCHFPNFYFCRLKNFAPGPLGHCTVQYICRQPVFSTHATPYRILLYPTSPYPTLPTMPCPPGHEVTLDELLVQQILVRYGVQGGGTSEY